MNTLNPASTALLVVHLQDDIVSPGTALGSLFSPEVRSRNILAKCYSAMAAIRGAGGLVVPLRLAFASDYSDLDPTVPLLQLAKEAGCLKEGSEGSAIVPEIAVLDTDIVVTHKLPGPFSSSLLNDVLKSRGIENVVVCGVATNASVEAAVRQAADLGYKTYVLSDATSAASEAAHQASVASMTLFARVMTLPRLKASLLTVADESKQ
ncbi:cysteine hydrolase [Pseudarthrobacter sp. fls2-241-R2A-168]|uniref:cysteine hydrolase family protein n=1 Tax=Pseudarthrobacter sp. fls2-241-R2A-168 TaxID=3040304 RepID=UPI002554CC10|nr:cysteine hydrolase [Pseudarthrobacter sp. fls2-241-R2A-168]